VPTSKIQLPDISASHSSARDAVDHAIRFLEAELAKPRFTVPKGESKFYLEMRRDLPYIVHETALPETQILVNRNYKPLGNSSRTGENWVNYELATNGHVQLTPEQMKVIVSTGRERGLFGDENPPWSGRRDASAYLERLKALRNFL
jgi:hypothetical protein